MIGPLVALVALLLLAAFAAVAETVIARMDRVKAHHLAQDRANKTAELLVEIVEDPAPFLNIVRLLAVSTHVAGTAVATAVAVDRWGSGGYAAAAAVAALVIFVFAEMVPKTYAVQRLEGSARFVARPVHFLGKALRPIGKLSVLLANAAMVVLPGKGLPKGPFVTEEEIRHLAEVAEEEEEIEEEERELIHSIFEFGDTIVREVMVPRPDMITLPAISTVNEALDVVVKEGYSRIPIYEGDTDNIIGVVYAKDLLERVHRKERSVKLPSVARAPTFVPEQKKVAELLREMQQQRVHLAIVVDEYGGTAGLVSIEDLLEEIVGEIVDEYDVEEPMVETVDESVVRVDGRFPIDELNELLDVDLPHEEWDTVGGLVFGLTGRVPEPGEEVTFDSVSFRTERVTGRRIQKVLVTKTTARDDEELAEPAP